MERNSWRNTEFKKGGKQERVLGCDASRGQRCACREQAFLLGGATLKTLMQCDAGR